jgi:hypothetical protein
VTCLDGVTLEDAAIYFHWIDAAPGHLVQIDNPNELGKPPVIGMRCTSHAGNVSIDFVLLLDGENAGTQVGHPDMPAPAIDVTKFVQVQIKTPAPRLLNLARLTPGCLYWSRGSAEIYILMRGAKLMCIYDPTGKNTGRKIENPNIERTVYLGEAVLNVIRR